MQTDALPLNDVVDDSLFEEAFQEHVIDFGGDDDAVYTPAITLWALTNATLIAIAHATVLFRPPRHFQAFATPKTIRSVKTNSLPFTLKQLRDATVAETRMLTNQLQHPCQQTRLIIRSLRLITLRTSMLRCH